MRDIRHVTETLSACLSLGGARLSLPVAEDDELSASQRAHGKCEICMLEMLLSQVGRGLNVMQGKVLSRWGEEARRRGGSSGLG